MAVSCVFASMILGVVRESSVAEIDSTTRIPSRVRQHR
jgi:hypothetical protein